MRIFSALSLLALLTLPASAGAQCAICIGQSSKDDTCPLRSSGPLSKGDIKDASDLLVDLDRTKESLKTFREVSDSGDASFYYQTKSVPTAGCQSVGYYGGCTVSIQMGSIGDVRDMITGALKAKIEKAACRLRSIGVDVPKP